MRRHYDLGDDLFEAFLDGSMTYSCGYARSPADDLATLQLNKMERIYLPTVDKGGLDYADSGVLFTRARGRVAMTVVPWRGATASGWQRTSASRGTLFSVGRGSPRICGFL